MGGDVFARYLRLGLQPHQDHRVERVDGRHQKRFSVPIVVGLTQRFQIVVGPGVFLVAIPGVQEFRAYLGR